jgi:hypothetical protein
MTSRMAVITVLDGGGPVDPGFGQTPPLYPSQGLPGGGGHPSTGPVLPPGGVTLPVWPFDPTRPDQGLPGYGHPDQGLPGRPPRPDQGLPGSGARPDQGLPGSQPGVDNTLPGGPPPHVDAGLPVPGKRYVVKWIACHGMILVPDNSLPSGPPPRPDQGLPPTPEPK